MKRLVLAIVGFALLPVAAFGADPYLGKWASDPKDCKSDDLPITIKPNAIIGSTFGCTDVKYKKKGTGWTATGACSNEEAPFVLQLDLAVNDGKLNLDWHDKDTSPMTYSRCAK